MAATTNDMRCCTRCGHGLVAAARSPHPVEAPGEGPLQVLVKGLPLLKCPACGQLQHPGPAVGLARRLKRYTLDALGLALDDARRDNTPQLGLYAAGEVGTILIDLGAAQAEPEPLPAAESSAELFEVKPLATLRSLHDVDLAGEVHEALQDFLALVRKPLALKEALGSHLHQEVDWPFLSLGGAPGVGKNHIAEGLARELGRDLYVLDASAVTSSLVGETEKNLRRLFEQVRAKGAILFVDEADSFADARLRASTGHEKALNQVRNALIGELNRHQGVVIFATNLRDCYDPALARRMEDVHVPTPDPAQRRRLWKRMLGGSRLRSSLDDAWIAALDRRVERHERQHGDPERPFTGADMKRVVRKAGARALRRAGDGPVELLREDVEQALEQHLHHLAALRKAKPDDLGAARDVAQTSAAILQTTVARLRGRIEAWARGRPDSSDKPVKYQVAAEAVMTSQERDLRSVVELLEQLAPVLAADDPQEQLLQLRAMMKVSSQRAA